MLPGINFCCLPVVPSFHSSGLRCVDVSNLRSQVSICWAWKQWTNVNELETAYIKEQSSTIWSSKRIWTSINEGMGKRKSEMKLSSRKNGTLVPEDDSDSDLQEFSLPKKRIIKPGKSTYVARLDCSVSWILPSQMEEF